LPHNTIDTISNDAKPLDKSAFDVLRGITHLRACKRVDN
jgi:hypothetical protein